MNKVVKNAIRGAITGVTLLGTAFAGVALIPVDELTKPDEASVQSAVDDGSNELSLAAQTLETGEALVGAAKVSLEPRPQDFDGAYWERDASKCSSASVLANPDTRDHVADWRSPWIENTNCIYMGGYGIGPSNPITSWDPQYGLYARTTVFTDTQGDSIVLTLLDAEGFFGNYNSLCGPLEPRCGAWAISEDMTAELAGTDPNLKPDGFVIASTHSHTALDLIGGWGAVPDWYFDQVVIAIKDSIREAFLNRVPATIEAGESLARGFNGERRSKYRSAEDPSVNWVRALDRSGNAIATVSTFATHPVGYDEGLGIGHSDWPGAASALAESNGNGMSTFFQAGLGNMTGGGQWETKGKGIGERIPPIGSGTKVSNPDIRVRRTFWDHPVTNGPLGALGGGGFFDKPFGGPATISAGKSSQAPCRSASPVSARVSVSAMKIGPVVITAAPGETFANFSNTIEERSPITALAIGQANDALGYMPQSFESDHSAREGLGFVGKPYFEYEDAYSIDACFGDAALENTIALLNSL